jgi:hypothetical protein
MQTKKFALFKSLYLGKEHYVLKSTCCDSLGYEFAPLTIYMRELINGGAPTETLRAYGLSIGGFINYFDLGLSYITHNTQEINELYRNYHSYLTVGENSSSDVVQKICITLPSPKVMTSSSRTYHAPIKDFLKELSRNITAQKDLERSGLIESSPPLEELTTCLSKITPSYINTTRRQREARNAKTSVPRANSDTPNVKPSFNSHIPETSWCDIPLTDSDYFPFEHIRDLIYSARSYRNRTLWALLAACGPRESEADQMLWSDLSANSEVHLIDPHTRNHPEQSYMGITEIERNKLQWKGRNTHLTVLLEPYGEIFFESLALYKKHEYIYGTGHNFIFQTNTGRPLYLADYKSVVYEQFKSAAKRVLSGTPHQNKTFAPHSLRHSYIFFFKNYLEHSNGIGLSDHELLMLTGHTSMDSLRKYGKLDREIMLEKISYAMQRLRKGTPKSAMEYQIAYLEERINIFKNNLRNN